MSRSIDDAVIASVLETLKQGRLFRYDCQAPEESPTARLERRFAETLGVRYAIALNSCSSGLFLSLVTCGVQPGDEVLIPAFTFIAVPSAVVHAQARPVLVEVTDDYVLDCDALEGAITPRTRALLLSYMRGRVPDLDRVTEICARRGIALIEDAAHGLGVQWDGVPVGRFGRAAAFSFQSYKLLDSGEGGMMVTDDREVALRAMLLAGCTERNWQRHFVDEADAEWLDATVNSLPVYAFRMSNLSAAALLPQLDRIEDRVRRHNEAYTHLVARLTASPAIRVPAYLPKVRPAADTIQFEIRGLDRERLGRFVEQVQGKGVPLEIFGLGPRNARCFWNWRFFSPNDCPRTRALLGRTADLRLPLGLDRRLLDYFADVVLDSVEAAATGP